MNLLKNSKIEKLKDILDIQSLNMPAKSSFYLTAANLMAKGAAFLFTPIFTRLLTPAEYGEYSLFSSYLSLAIVLATLEIPGNIIMRAFQKRRGLEHTSVLIAALVPAALSLPCILAIYFLMGNGGLTFPLAYVFLFVSLICASYINLYVSKCKFLYNWRGPLIIALIQSVIAPIISIILLRTGYFYSYSHISVKIGTITVINAIITAALLFISIRHAVRERKDAEESFFGYTGNLISLLIKLSLPLLPYYFSVMTISQADKFFISAYIGKEALGKYSVAYSAGIALTALTGGLMSALCPWIMRKVRASEFDTISRTLERVIKLAVPVIIIFLCAAPEIFRILAPEEYENALPVLYISAIIPLPLAASQSLCSIAVAKEKTFGVLICGLIPAFLTVALNFLLSKYKIMLIPAIITALGYFILMFCETVNVRKILGKSLLNVNKMLQIILFLSFSSAAIYAFRSSLIFRGLGLLSALASLLYMLKNSLWLLKDR